MSRGRFVDQGRDEIVIAAPRAAVWELVSDSPKLAEWGPPVRGVTVLSTGAPGPASREVLGARRRIEAEFDGRRGTFVETRVEHDEGRVLAYVIDEEDFGLFKLLEDVGFRIELADVDALNTRVTWTFFHEPRGLIGRVMNRLVILRSQRKNRLLALAALKRYAERS